MTATDELRRLLDERGVEYYESPNGVAWGKLATPIHGRMYTHYAVELDGLLCVDSHCLTPAQAVEATLGCDEPPCDRLVERLREDWGIDASWDGLRRFWCVQLTEEGVRLRDEREVTLGRGTCRMILRDDIYGHAYQDIYECSVCGEQVIRETYMGESEPPRFCPNCGAYRVG